MTQSISRVGHCIDNGPTLRATKLKSTSLSGLHKKRHYCKIFNLST